MKFEDFQSIVESERGIALVGDEVTQSYVKGDIRSELNKGFSSIKEAKDLIENDTIDSYLRYFQTGVYADEHIPSLLLDNDKIVQKLLASKLEPLINEMGLGWNKRILQENGEMELTYKKSGISLNFAYFNPFERTIKFNFDINEMERDREIRVHNIRQAMSEAQEKWTNTIEYLDETDSSLLRKLFNLRNRKAIERLRGNVNNISDELNEMEVELDSLMKNKILLENIKAKLPMMEREFSRFGIKIHFAKGEEYDI